MSVWCWVVWVLYTFWILTPYEAVVCKYLLPVGWLPFFVCLFCWWFLLMCWSCLFLFLFLLLWYSCIPLFLPSLWCGPQPVGSMCCGCDEQIHVDYRSPVEKKGQHDHSLSERAPWPLPGQAFIAFLGTLHQGWFSFTMHRFALGGYLLQITKERKLLITTKKKDICKCKGKSGWTGYTPSLGDLA